MNEQLTLVLEWIAMLFLLAGALLTFIAGIGMVRFPDLLSRMHAASKPQVLGLIFVLIGLGLELLSVETNVFSVGSLILVALFQIVTIPVAGHIAARVGYRTDLIRRDLLSVDELAEQIDRQEREEEEARLRFR
ncbi:MAG TPA: monovalent cation/H(+) antiporter subunit G [Candidatus Nocardiopsis merdipullorum]|nr:monovalent cation/H(+) antiporter subunit G [Candidatus Nocardiopsis merdipullorum]